MISGQRPRFTNRMVRFLPTLLALFVLACVQAVGGAQIACAQETSRLTGPQPGDVFKEYTYSKEITPKPAGTFTSEGKFSKTRVERRYVVDLNIDDLEGATRAEMIVEYWGGHIGTSEQKFSVNGGAHHHVAHPTNTPTRFEAYYRQVMGNPAVSFPVSDLEEGTNEIEFHTGPQIEKYSFGSPVWRIYSFTIRVYYEDSKPHPTGKITSPSPGAQLGDNPRIEVEAESEQGAIQQVDLVGLYRDYDFEGNGVFRQWHYQVSDGKLQRHIGTATQAPHEVVWDTEWVPDQEKPMKLMAQIVDSTGMHYMTPAVEGLTFHRPRSVKLYEPYNVPEKFGVRTGMERKGCNIDVPDFSHRAQRARLFLTTWSGSSAQQVGLNKTVIADIAEGIGGSGHDYAIDAIPVPLDAILEGGNRFWIYSHLSYHAAEVNWPGPALLVEYSANDATQ